MQYDLNRFLVAQHFTYEKAIRELKNGYKDGHWMWFIFPQFQGLGKSQRANFYSIKSIDEAKAYLEDEILGKRLIECCQILLELPDRPIRKIFSYLDSLKLQSSMTLFFEVSKNQIFKKVLDKYFNGEEDKKTLKLIKNK